MTKKYDLIIFDWDGTLVDSKAHITECMKNGMKKAGVTVPSDQDIHHIIGLSLEKAINTLLPAVSTEQQRQVAEYYREAFFQTANEAVNFFPDALDTVKQLKEAGYYLAVATGKSRRGLDLVLQKMDLEHLFHITRCADETASKPDPLMLHEILTDLDMTVDRAVMVGDTTYDMEMAHHAKMDSIAVTYGSHDVATLQNVNPTYLLSKIDSIQYVV